ncbi:MAG TPA: sigma-70 family RNA polymerase sigma factor [Polyangiaceae bacterium]|nr:sigma-70 family RNA polymerase sigma factor [Polyangiaceae bacterium]
MPSRSRAVLFLAVGKNRGEASDAELARGLIAGEPWAVSEAWRRFAPMVLMTAERALGSRTEAEDVAQDAFIRLFRSVKTLREPERLRSFVYSIAIRTLKSQLRHRRLRAWLSFQDPETLAELRYFTLDLESRDALRRFYILLDRLSTRDRLVFILRRVEAMTVEEIATTMDIAPSTVKRSMLNVSKRLSRWVETDPSLMAYVDGNFEAR